MGDRDGDGGDGGDPTTIALVIVFLHTITICTDRPGFSLVQFIDRRRNVR